MKTTAERLFWLRETAGLTRPELEALAVGDNGKQLTRGHVWLIENDERKDLGSSTANRLAAVFGCTSEWLTSGHGGQPSAREVNKAVEAAKSRARRAQKATGTSG